MMIEKEFICIRQLIACLERKFVPGGVAIEGKMAVSLFPGTRLFFAFFFGVLSVLDRGRLMLSYTNGL